MGWPWYRDAMRGFGISTMSRIKPAIWIFFVVAVSFIVQVLVRGTHDSRAISTLHRLRDHVERQSHHIEVLVSIDPEFNFPDLLEAAQYQLSEKITLLYGYVPFEVTLSKAPEELPSSAYSLRLSLTPEIAVMANPYGTEVVLTYTLASIHSNDLPYFMAQAVLDHLLEAHGMLMYKKFNVTRELSDTFSIVAHGITTELESNITEILDPLVDSIRLYQNFSVSISSEETASEDLLVLPSGSEFDSLSSLENNVTAIIASRYDLPQHVKEKVVSCLAAELHYRIKNEFDEIFGLFDKKSLQTHPGLLETFFGVVDHYSQASQLFSLPQLHSSLKLIHEQLSSSPA